MPFACDRSARRALLFCLPLLLSIVFVSCGHRPETVDDADFWSDLALANPDTVTVDEFLALPVEEQTVRRERAARFAVSSAKLLQQDELLYDRQYRQYAVNYEARFPDRIMVRDVVFDLQRLVLWDPTDAAAWHLLAELHALHTYTGQALDDFERAWAALDAAPLEDPEKDRDLRLRIAADAGWACRDRGWWPQAHNWLDRGREISAGNVELKVITGLVNAGEGRIGAAIAVAEGMEPVPYEEIIFKEEGLAPSTRTRETGAPGRWVKAVAEHHAGEPELAEHVLQPVRDLQTLLPWSHRYWQDVGLVYETVGHEDAGLAYALSSLQRPYVYGDVAAGFSSPSLVLGKPRLDVPYFVTSDGAFAAGSRFAYAAQLALGYLADPAGPGAGRRLDDAQTALDLCQAHGIWPARVRALRGRLSFAASRYESAELELNAASDAFTARGETEPQTELLLGLLALRAKDNEAARERLERAAAADSLLGPAWGALGVARVAAGDTRGAREALDRAVVLQPHKASVWFNRGLFRARHDDLLGAREDLEIAAKLDAGNTSIINLLQRVEVARRQGESSLPRSRDGEGSVSVRILDGETGDAGDLVIDRHALMRQYVAELDRAFGTPADSVQVANSPVDSLNALYEADPTPELRKELALVELYLGRYERAQVLLMPHWAVDLDAEENIMLLYADRQLGETKRAMELLEALSEGGRRVADPYEWALVATMAQQQVLLGKNMVNAAYMASNQNYHVGMVAYWMDVGFALWRHNVESVSRYGFAPQPMTFLMRAVERITNPAGVKPGQGSGTSIGGTPLK